MLVFLFLVSPWVGQNWTDLSGALAVDYTSAHAARKILSSLSLLEPQTGSMPPCPLGLEKVSTRCHLTPCFPPFPRGGSL